MSSAPRRVPRLPGRPSPEREAAVARRLDLLRAELAGGPVLRTVPDEPDEFFPDDVGSIGLVGSGDDWWSPATRVPGVRLPGTPAPDDAPAPSPWSAPAAAVVEPARVPVPGRHASRRSRDVLGDLVPDTLRGRLALGPAQLTVVAVLVALGLAVTAWTVVRSSPEPVTPAPVADSTASGEQVLEAPLAALPVASVPPPAASSAATGAVQAAAPAGSQGSVTVDVAGKVRRPGIAVLDSGARVVDAIEAAGGARAGIDLTPLNLARVLVDGEQIVVGVDPPPGVAASALGEAGAAAAPSAGVPAGALVNLNSAGEAELDTLSGVGPVTAQSIIAWRTEHGGYTSVDELLEVDGIGPATLARLAPHVTV